MDIVKYQLHILYIGLGIEKAHHAYSKYVHTYMVEKLFKQLVETEILLYIDLKRKAKLLTGAPLKLPFPPNVATLGSMSELGNDLYKKQVLRR